MQSKVASLVETIFSTVVGFFVSLILNLFIFPAVGCQISTAQNIGIICVFTIASILRSYFIRRLFVYMHGRFNF